MADVKLELTEAEAELLLCWSKEAGCRAPSELVGIFLDLYSKLFGRDAEYRRKHERNTRMGIVFARLSRVQSSLRGLEKVNMVYLNSSLKDLPDDMQEACLREFQRTQETIEKLKQGTEELAEAAKQLAQFVHKDDHRVASQ